MFDAVRNISKLAAVHDVLQYNFIVAWKKAPMKSYGALVGQLHKTGPLLPSQPA